MTLGVGDGCAGRDKPIARLPLTLLIEADDVGTSAVEGLMADIETARRYNRAWAHPAANSRCPVAFGNTCLLPAQRAADAAGSGPSRG